MGPFRPRLRAHNKYLPFTMVQTWTCSVNTINLLNLLGPNRQVWPHFCLNWTAAHFILGNSLRSSSILRMRVIWRTVYLRYIMIIYLNVHHYHILYSVLFKDHSTHHIWHTRCLSTRWSPSYFGNNNNKRRKTYRYADQTARSVG